jgi:hypothetical protein
MGAPGCPIRRHRHEQSQPSYVVIRVLFVVVVYLLVLFFLFFSNTNPFHVI